MASYETFPRHSYSGSNSENDVDSDNAIPKHHFVEDGSDSAAVIQNGSKDFENGHDGSSFGSSGITLCRNIFSLCCLMLLLLGTFDYFVFWTNLENQASETPTADGAELVFLDNTVKKVSIGGRLETTVAVMVATAKYHVNNTYISMKYRTYDGYVAGPEFHVNKGDKVTLHIQNDLEGDDGYNNGYSSPSYIKNTFHSPNTTNVHIHGIHASPLHEDNVFRTVNPGERVTYNYQLMPEHPAGTFYVHPHFHGSSTIQIGYSMASAFIIHDDPADIKGTKIELVETDLAIVIGYVDVGSGSGRDILKNSVYSDSRLPLHIHAEVNNPDSSVAPFSFLTANGKWNPVVQTKENTWYRIRLINAVIDGVVSIKAVGENDTLEDVCEFHNIANDGIYFEKSRLLSLTRESSIIISPGSRKDIMFRCDQLKGNIRIVSTNTNLLGTGTTTLAGELFQIAQSREIRVEQRKNQQGRQKEKNQEFILPTLTSLYSDLRNEPVDPENVFFFKYTFPGPGTNPLLHQGRLYKFYGVNGELYTGEVKVRVRRDIIHEWVIINDFAMDGTPATESHPFHMHTNHFQVVSIKGKKTNISADFRVGEFRDTISIPPGTNVSIRFRPKHFPGISLAHCHIFTHSDTGMIINYEIL